MPLSLISPALMASFSTGATLQNQSSVYAPVPLRGAAGSLVRVRRIDYHGLLGLVVDYQVGIVVTLPHP